MMNTTPHIIGAVADRPHPGMKDHRPGNPGAARAGVGMLQPVMPQAAISGSWPLRRLDIVSVMERPFAAGIRTMRETGV